MVLRRWSQCSSLHLHSYEQPVTHLKTCTSSVSGACAASKIAPWRASHKKQCIDRQDALSDAEKISRSFWHDFTTLQCLRAGLLVGTNTSGNFGSSTAAATAGTFFSLNRYRPYLKIIRCPSLDLYLGLCRNWKIFPLDKWNLLVTYLT